MSVGAALALAALWAGPMPAGAPPAGTPSALSQFDALLVEIDSLRSDLEWLGRSERNLVNEMDRLEAGTALGEREIRKVRLEKDGLEADLINTRERLESHKRLVAIEESRLASQLREFYKLGQLKELRLLLSVRKPEDFLPAVAYLNVLAERQEARVATVRRGRDEMNALERTLDAQTRGLDSMILSEQRRLEELRDLRERSREILKATTEQRESHVRAIEELSRAARELESAIMSGRRGEPLAPVVDIGKLKGSLEWPVIGMMEVPFGDIRHPKFNTATQHPGVDFRTEPGAPIQAILGGRVVFSRRFSGYGNTVLLDHGGNYLSVYARASVLHVAEGDEVLPGQVLGTSPDRAFDGGPPIVYFELRREGRAVDPADWLKRKPGRRKEDQR